MNVTRDTIRAAAASAYGRTLDCQESLCLASPADREARVEQLRESCQDVIDLHRGALLSMSLPEMKASESDVLMSLSNFLPEMGLLEGQYGFSVRSSIIVPRGEDKEWDTRCLESMKRWMQEVTESAPAGGEDGDPSLSESDLAVAASASFHGPAGTATDSGKEAVYDQLIEKLRDAKRKGLHGSLPVAREEAELLAEIVRCDLVSISIESEEEFTGEGKISLIVVCMRFVEAGANIWSDERAKQVALLLTSHWTLERHWAGSGLQTSGELLSDE